MKCVLCACFVFAIGVVRILVEVAKGTILKVFMYSSAGWSFIKS